MKKKIIVFEEISNPFRLLIKWYLFRGFAIFYYRISTSCKEKEWLRRFTEKKLISRIDDEYGLLNTAIGYYPDLAYQNIDKIFERFFKENKIVKLLIGLYKDERIYNVFKKSLLGYLQRFYYINFIIFKLSELFPEEKVYFVPTLKRKGYRTHILSAYEYHFLSDLIFKSQAFYFGPRGAVFPLWFNLVSKLYYLLRYIRIQLDIAGFILFSMAVSVRNLLIPRVPKKKYKFGVMIISPAHQFANKIRRVDFLIDGEKIKKKDVLFISSRRLSRHKHFYMQEQRLNFVDALFYKINLRVLKVVLPIAILLILNAVRNRRAIFLIESAILQLVCFGIWRSFTERYHLDNLISHCDFGPQSLARNIFLSKSGTKTWYYTDAINWGNFFISEYNRYNLPLYNHAIGFLIYDYFVSWSDELINYFRIHHQDIKKHINVGCFWASHIRQIREHKIKSGVLDTLYRHGFRDEYKLISVFDSSYSDYTITTYEDGIVFVKGMFRLLEEFPNIFILFKEKKARVLIRKPSPEILIWLKRLQEHPRCYLPFWDMNTSEAIAFSDLTISFPFTSTTFEALSARKKGLYYDVSNKFRGTFYDGINGLVCHNYDELFKRTKELLFEVDEPTYNQYLDRHVKGKLEPYLDGNALVRFRELLTNSK